MLSSLIASPPDFKSSVMPGPLMTSSQFMDGQQYVNIQDVPFCFSDSSPAISPRVMNLKACLKSLLVSTPQHSDNLVIGVNANDTDTSVIDFKDYFTHPVSPQSDGSFSGHSTDSERCSPAHSICSLSPDHSLDGLEDIDLNFNLDSISEDCELLSCLETTCDEAMSPNGVSTSELAINNIQALGQSISSGLSNRDFNPISPADLTFSSAECPSSQFSEQFIKQELDEEFTDEFTLAFHELMQTPSETCASYLSRSPVFPNALNSSERLAHEFLNHHVDPNFAPNFALSKDDFSVSPFENPFLDVDSKPVLASNAGREINSYSSGFSFKEYSDKSPLINNWNSSQKGCMDMSECDESNKSNEEELLAVKTNAVSVAFNKIIKSEPVDKVGAHLSSPYSITGQFLTDIFDSKELKLPKDPPDITIHLPDITVGLPDITDDIPNLIENDDIPNLSEDAPDLTNEELVAGIPDTPEDIPALSKPIPVSPKPIPVSPKPIPVSQKRIPVSQKRIPVSQKRIPDSPRNGPDDLLTVVVNTSSSPSEAVKCDHCYAKSELADTPIKLEVDVIPDYSEELIQAQTPAKRRPGRPRKVVAVPTEYHAKTMTPKATHLKKHKRSLPPSTKKVKLQSGSSVRTDRREQHNKAERLRRYAIKESMFIVASKCPEYIFYATQSALQSSKSHRCEEIENNFTVEVLRKIDEIIKKGELENKRYKYKKATNYSKMVMLLGVTYFVSNLEKELKAKENHIKLNESVLRHTVNKPSKRTKKC